MVGLFFPNPTRCIMTPMGANGQGLGFGRRLPRTSFTLASFLKRRRGSGWTPKNGGKSWEREEFFLGEISSGGFFWKALSRFGNGFFQKNHNVS